MKSEVDRRPEGPFQRPVSRDRQTLIQYEHTQPGTLIRVILATILVVASAAAFYPILQGREPELPALIPAAVLLGVLCLFHSLTVKVTSNDIVISFGPGLFQKSFMIADLERAAVVRTRWYHGWGIKKIWGGWLFSVSGFDAVQIDLRNGKLYQIGTDEPQRLQEAIRQAMEESRSFRR